MTRRDVVRRYLKAAEMLRADPKVSSVDIGRALGITQSAGWAYLNLARELAAEAAPALKVVSEGQRVASVAARRPARVVAAGSYEIPVFQLQK